MLKDSQWPICARARQLGHHRSQINGSVASFKRAIRFENNLGRKMRKDNALRTANACLSLSRPVLRRVVLGVLEMECEIGLTGRNHPDVAGASYIVANNLSPVLFIIYLHKF